MNNALVNKNLYKIFLSLVKYLPMMLALIQVVGTILNYFGIVTALIPCLGGVSVLFIILLYIISYVFRFCYLYRMPLWYITVILLISIIDSFVGIPFSTLTMFRIHWFITGAFIITFISYAYKNRNNPKVDYISDLCKRYLCCE